MKKKTLKSMAFALSAMMMIGSLVGCGAASNGQAAS